MFVDIPTFTISGMTVVWIAREAIPLLVKWQMNRAQQAVDNAKQDDNHIGDANIEQWKDWVRLIVKEELMPLQSSIRELNECVNSLKRKR